MPHLYIAKNWFLEQQALKGLIRIDTRSLVSPAQAARLIICDAFFFIFNLGHKRGTVCKAFLAETVETGNKNRCLIEATYVLRRKLRKD